MRVFSSLYWEKCEKSMKIANTSDNPPFTTSPKFIATHTCEEKEKRGERRGRKDEGSRGNC